MAPLTGIWALSREDPKDERAVGPITEQEDQTAGWADRFSNLEGVPEDLYYADNESFQYPDENAPQISEGEFLAKISKDFAWFAEFRPEYAAAIELLMEFRCVFTKNVDVSRPVKCPPMVINTIDEAPVGMLRPDRFTPNQMIFMDKEVPRLLRLRVLRTSTSLWNNPVILREKGETWRMCNDNRELNKKTIRIASAIPLIADVLYDISAAKIFSKMDMTQGFLQIELDEDSKKKTTFTIYSGTYEYNVGGLGLTKDTSDL